MRDRPRVGRLDQSNLAIPGLNMRTRNTVRAAVNHSIAAAALRHCRRPRMFLRNLRFA
jgi:hypothetical protein